MGKYNFRLDLATAKETEKEAVEKLHKHLKIKNVSFNTDYKYDFRLEFEGTTKPRTYEVKEDFQCGQTGNTVVEYECRGKDSGITTTEADFWIYKLDDGFYQISTEKLRGVIKEELYFREVVGGDRGSNTKMYLFRLPTLKKRMQKL